MPLISPVHKSMRNTKYAKSGAETIAAGIDRTGTKPEDQREQGHMGQDKGQHADAVGEQLQARKDPPFVPLHGIKLVNRHQGDRQDKKSQVKAAQHPGYPRSTPPVDFSTLPMTDFASLSRSSSVSVRSRG